MDGGHAWVKSSSAGGVCPADPSNAISERLEERKSWRYVDGKGALRDGDVKLHCSMHSPSALVMEVEKGNIHCVRELLEGGVSTRGLNADGLAPLIIAIEKGYVALVRLLLQFGASTRDTNRDGLTPILIAAKQGHREILEVLFDNKVDVVEAADVAARKGFIPLVRCLQQYLEKGVSFIFNHISTIGLLSTYLLILLRV